MARVLRLQNPLSPDQIDRILDALNGSGGGAPGGDGTDGSMGETGTPGVASSSYILNGPKGQFTIAPGDVDEGEGVYLYNEREVLVGRLTTADYYFGPVRGTISIKFTDLPGESVDTPSGGGPSSIRYVMGLRRLADSTVGQTISGTSVDLTDTIESLRLIAYDFGDGNGEGIGANTRMVVAYKAEQMMDAGLVFWVKVSLHMSAYPTETQPIASWLRTSAHVQAVDYGDGEPTPELEEIHVYFNFAYPGCAAVEGGSQVLQPTLEGSYDVRSQSGIPVTVGVKG